MVIYGDHTGSHGDETAIRSFAVATFSAAPLCPVEFVSSDSPCIETQRKGLQLTTMISCDFIIFIASCRITGI